MTYAKDRRKKPLSVTITARLSDVRILNIAILAMTAALVVGYLAVSTQSATKGFTIRTLEREISVLEDDQKRLDIEAVARQSMETIEGRITGLGFVPVPAVDYVNAGASMVAVR